MVKFIEMKNTDYIHVEVGEEDDDFNLVINNKLELHIKASEGNFSIDAYKYWNQENEEDHDYGEDFIQGMGWVSADDLN